MSSNQSSEYPSYGSEEPSSVAPPWFCTYLRKPGSAAPIGACTSRQYRCSPARQCSPTRPGRSDSARDQNRRGRKVGTTICHGLEVRVSERDALIQRMHVSGKSNNSCVWTRLRRASDGLPHRSKSPPFTPKDFRSSRHRMASECLVLSHASSSILRLSGQRKYGPNFELIRNSPPASFPLAVMKFLPSRASK
jgi:hypothetical protein